MDASDLRMFEAVARLGGIGRAAAELNTVQSNVTARIQALEHDLGCTLFDRHSRGVTLTEAGTRLLPYAAEVADVLARARRAVLDDGTPRGPLVIGSLETTAGLRLPPVLAAFSQACPAVDLTLRTGTTAESIADVLARRLEGAFVAGPVDHPDLLQTVVFREELVLVTAFALRRLPDLRQVAGLRTLVLRVGCSYRQRLETVLATRGILDVRCQEFGSLDAILGCIGAGMGVTLLPRGVVAAAQREGRVAVHPLPEAEAMVDTLFVRRRDVRMTRALAAFLHHVQAAETVSAAAA
ncbi:MAG: LysR family transcriptional regulator [Acetobacteraceae bacterium]|nr:LysR family transcriptional regulator [Acetobacteraceae bacterium]